MPRRRPPYFRQQVDTQSARGGAHAEAGRTAGTRGRGRDGRRGGRARWRHRRVGRPERHEDRRDEEGRDDREEAVAMAWRASLVVAALVAPWLVAGTAAAQASRLGTPAPEVAGERWINSAPLTTQALRGRVVLVEFWTFG